MYFVKGTMQKISTIQIWKTSVIVIITLIAYLLILNSSDNRSAEVREYIQQRNNISRLLNLKQQLIGQMECEEKANGSLKTSNTGGWCAQVSGEDDGEHITDRELVNVLAELFTGKYVASFGDGPGRYKQLLLETGKLKGYDAYDGAPYSEITSEGRVKFMDMAIPQFGLPVYDWVISLEVAEHIPREYEGTFLDNIVRHAKEGVVLSWSSVNAGYGHVNKRPFEYVVKVMDDLGFKFDKDETEKLKGGASKKWLQRNVNVYKRKDLDESIEKFMFNHA